MEEGKKGLSQAVMTQIDEWLEAPLESIQSHLDLLERMPDLNTDDVAALIQIGQRIALARQIEQKPKPGRPRGSKTRKAAEVQP